MEEKYKLLAQNLSTMYNDDLVAILKLIMYEQDVNDMVEYTSIQLDKLVADMEVNDTLEE